MEIATILENKTPHKIYGLIGNINITTNINKYAIITPYKFNNTVKDYLNSQKDINALKMVMLDESYLDKKSNSLSEPILKSINLAKALTLNKEYLIFDYFEKGFNDQEKKYYRWLFKKLTQKYHKTILVFSNDITFMWDISDELIIIDKKNLKTIPKKEILNNTKYFNPEIIRFTNLVKAKGLKINYYKDCKDLLKAIYRLKEQK